jgi:cell division septum initiation protein DivIVA
MNREALNKQIAVWKSIPVNNREVLDTFIDDLIERIEELEEEVENLEGEILERSEWD